MSLSFLNHRFQYENRHFFGFEIVMAGDHGTLKKKYNVIVCFVGGGIFIPLHSFHYIDDNLYVDITEIINIVKYLSTEY